MQVSTVPNGNFVDLNLNFEINGKEAMDTNSVPITAIVAELVDVKSITFTGEDSVIDKVAVAYFVVDFCKKNINMKG